MANIKSAKKRINVIEKKTARNKRVKAHIKAVLKSFDAAIAEGDMESAKKYLDLAEKKLMQSVSKGINHKNTAARKISRLNKRFNQANA
ncbi:MAG: 30S ribosomal protein S20 [Anaerovoracaceae bacterium]